MPSFTPSYALLAPRDPFAEAKETLSSWDKCMEKAYCKYVRQHHCPRNGIPNTSSQMARHCCHRGRLAHYFFHSLLHRPMSLLRCRMRMLLFPLLRGLLWRRSQRENTAPRTATFV